MKALGNLIMEELSWVQCRVTYPTDPKWNEIYREFHKPPIEPLDENYKIAALIETNCNVTGIQYEFPRIDYFRKQLLPIVKYYQRFGTLMPLKLFEELRKC